MADFLINVKVDPRGAVQGAKQVQGSLKKVESQAKALQTVLIRTFAIIGVTSGVTDSIKTMADFGQTMSTVSAISGATADQFEDLTAVAKDLGATTRFSATQAGEGLLFLSRAGFDVEKSISTVDDTLNLAQAGALGLGRAADIATNVLTGFRLETEDAGRVVDVLALAANSANTDVNQLGDAIKLVGPVAAGLGVELETATAAIAALSDAGLQATLAGTGLRRVLSEIESPSTKTEKILKQLGLTANDVKISQVGLIQALENLESAGVDTGLALELFGDRGGPAFEVLSSSIPKIKRMEASLLKAEGTAARMAAIMDDNLNGALLAVKSAFEAVILSIAAVGADKSLENFMRGLAKNFRAVAANIDIVKKGLEALGVVLALVFGPRILAAATAQLIKFGLVIAANPIGLLAIALAAVIVLLVAFRDEIAISSDGLVTLGDFGQAAFELIGDSLSALFAISGEGFPAMTTDAETASKATGAGFLTALATIAQVLDVTIALVFGLIDAFVFALPRIPRAFEDVMATAVNFWVDLFQDGVNKLIRIANGISGLVGIPKIPEIEFEGVKNEGVGGLEDLIRTTKDAFADQLDLTTPFADALNAALDRASEIAAERRGITGGGDGAQVKPLLGFPIPDDVTTPKAFAPGSPEFDEIIADLKLERELLQLSAREHGIRSEALGLAAGVEAELTAAQLAQIDSAVASTQAIRDQADLYDEIRGPQEQLIQKQSTLKDLFASGRISAIEYADALALIKQQLDEINGVDISGFERFKSSLEQTPDTTDILIGGFQRATDSIADFVANGTADFDRFAKDLLRQVTKLLLNQALLSLLSSFGGPGTAIASAGGPKSLGLPTFAGGGQFNVGGSGGTDSQTVAFNASPNERVRVETPAQQRASDTAQVQEPPKISIFNVTDPSEITEAMGGSEGEQVIINVISRNKNTIRQVVA